MKIAIKELFGNRWWGSSVEKKSTDEIREFDGAEIEVLCGCGEPLKEGVRYFLLE